MSSFKDLLAAQAAQAAKEQRELEVRLARQKEKEREVQAEKARRDKLEEERMKAARAAARAKEKEEAERAEKRAKEAEREKMNGAKVDKRELVAQAKKLGLIKPKEKPGSTSNPGLRTSSNGSTNGNGNAIAGPSRTVSISSRSSSGIQRTTIQLSNAERRALREAREFEDPGASPAERRKNAGRMMSRTLSGKNGAHGDVRQLGTGARKDSRTMLEVQREVQDAARGGSSGRGDRGKDGRGADPRGALGRHGDARQADANGKGKMRDQQTGRSDRPASRDHGPNRSTSRKRPKSPSPSNSESLESDDLDGHQRNRRREDERRHKRPRDSGRESGGGGGSILAKLGLDVNQLFGRKGDRRDYDSDGSSDMEADAATIAREEARAARLAREADRREEEEEARRAEEKRRRRAELARRG